MDFRYHTKRPFQEILQAERDEIDNVNAAWHRALTKYNVENPREVYLRDLLNSCTRLPLPLPLRVGHPKATGPEGFPNVRFKPSSHWSHFKLTDRSRIAILPSQRLMRLVSTTFSLSASLMIPWLER